MMMMRRDVYLQGHVGIGISTLAVVNALYRMVCGLIYKHPGSYQELAALTLLH